MKTFILRIALVLVSFVSSVATAQEKTVVTNDGTVYELVQPAQQPTAVMPGQKIRLGEQCTIARDGFWHQTTTCVWEQTLVASDEDLTVEAGGSASDTFVREDVVAIFIGISCMLLAMLLVHWAISSAATAATATAATAAAATAATGGKITAIGVGVEGLRGAAGRRPGDGRVVADDFESVRRTIERDFERIPGGHFVPVDVGVVVDLYARAADGDRIARAPVEPGRETCLPRVPVRRIPDGHVDFHLRTPGFERIPAGDTEPDLLAIDRRFDRWRG